MTQDEWLTYGLEQGWIIFGCLTHESLLTEEEEEAFEEGDDPCVPVMRFVAPLH